MPSADKKPIGNKENMENCVVKNEKTVEESNDPMELVLASIEKKIRNMEKRKAKLEQYSLDLKKGKQLTDDQKEAVDKLDELLNQMALTRDIHKGVQDINRLHIRRNKAVERQKTKDRHAKDVADIRQLMRIQETLNQLGNEPIRVHFKTGTEGAEKLSDDELSVLDELYEKLAPSQEGITSTKEWEARLDASALHAVLLLANSTKTFTDNISYKEASALIDRVMSCGYFERVADSRSNSPPQQDKSDGSTVSSAEETAPSHTIVSDTCSNSGARDSPSAIVGHANINFIQDDQTNVEPLMVKTGVVMPMYNNQPMQTINGVPTGEPMSDPPPPIPLPNQASPSSLDPNAPDYVPGQQGNRNGPNNSTGGDNRGRGGGRGGYRSFSNSRGGYRGGAGRGNRGGGGTYNNNRGRGGAPGRSYE